MRILFTLSLFLLFNILPGNAQKPESSGNNLSLRCEEIKGDLGLPYQSLKYESQVLLASDEDSECNDTIINNTYFTINKKFRVQRWIPTFNSNNYILNLITFVTDSSPPVS